MMLEAGLEQLSRCTIGVTHEDSKTFQLLNILTQKQSKSFQISPSKLIEPVLRPQTKTLQFLQVPCGTHSFADS